MGPRDQCLPEAALTALAALSDEQASRVILANPGVEPDGETAFMLVEMNDVQGGGRGPPRR
jgi:hypothetical protein